MHRVRETRTRNVIGLGKQARWIYLFIFLTIHLTFSENKVHIYVNVSLLWIFMGMRCGYGGGISLMASCLVRRA